ncbi:MAG: hypothetical protein ABJC79_02110 [Acidimicrobiia bacterium]
MELDLRKTAADAAYIAVGAGVLGFQQAQVRRREAGERIAAIAKDAQDTIGTQTATLRDRVTDTATTGIDTATATIKTLNPREWVEPVIGDVKQRVEPVIEQLKGFSVTAPVQALPEQLSKAVEVGKARVQSFRGQSNN